MLSPYKKIIWVCIVPIIHAFPMGLVTAKALTLIGGGNVGTSSAPLQMTEVTLTDDKSGGDAYVASFGALNLDGTTTGVGLLDVVLAGPIFIDAPLNIDNGADAGDTLKLNGTTMENGANNATASAITLNISGLFAAGTGKMIATAGTLTLQGSGNVGTGTGASALQTTVGTLTDNKGGGTAYINETDGINVNGTPSGSSLNLAAGGDVNINSALNFGAGTVTLKGATMENGANDVTASAITLNNSLLFTAGSGKTIATVGTLTLQGSGDVGTGTGASALQTTVGTIALAKTGGNSFLNQSAATPVILDGNSGGGNVTLTAGATKIDAANLASGGGNVTLNTTTLGLTGNLNAGAGNVTLNNSEEATLNGAGTGFGILTANGAGTLQVNNTIAGASVADSEGTTFNVASSPAVSTTGDQNYGGQVTLSKNTKLMATTIELAGVTGNGNNLTLGNSGLATLNGNVNGVGNLIVNGNTGLNASSVTTVGSQSYNGDLSLSGGAKFFQATTMSLAGDMVVNGGAVAINANFINTGTILVTHGYTLSFYGPVTNNGTIVALDGHVNFYSTLQNNGTLLLAPPPVLSVALSGGNAVLSWSSNYTGYALESTSSLNPAVWTLVPGTPAIIGSQYVLSAGTATNSRFFRLAPSISGTALSFDGVAAYVPIGASPLPPPWTAEFWVNRQDATDYSASLLGDASTALKLEQFNFTRRVGFTQFGVADYTFNYAAPTNTWVHLAFVSDTTTRLYVNGILQDTIVATIPLPLGRLGYDSSGNPDHLRGILDEVRVWNVARTQAQIKASMNHPLSVPQANLVGYWRFDEGSGTSAFDSSGQNKTGTLQNATAWVVSTAPLVP